MNWFKHDTDATTDSRLKKLIIRHGAIGYAIYFHCIELIAGDLNENHITFELEHDSEIIADNLRIQGTATMSAIDIVNMIMRDIVDLGLFEQRNEHIFCYKLLRRLDGSMTSNSRFRKWIADAKDSHDGVMIPSCKKRREEIRREEIRKEDKTLPACADTFTLFWESYPKKVEKQRALKTYTSKIKSGIKHESIMFFLDNYKKQLSIDNTDIKYTKHPSSFLNVCQDYDTIPVDNVPPPVIIPKCSTCDALMYEGYCKNPECPDVIAFFDNPERDREIAKLGGMRES